MCSLEETASLTRCLFVLLCSTINYCVRWDSDDTLSAEQRAGILDSLQRNVPKWTDGLTGFMGWPYSDIPVRLSRSRSRFFPPVRPRPNELPHLGPNHRLGPQEA
jgi:hypothetical protein